MTSVPGIQQGELVVFAFSSHTSFRSSVGAFLDWTSFLLAPHPIHLSCSGSRRYCVYYLRYQAIPGSTQWADHYSLSLLQPPIDFFLLHPHLICSTFFP